MFLAKFRVLTKVLAIICVLSLITGIMAWLGISSLHSVSVPLRRSPGFTLTAVAVLALGVGANTAVYSLVRPILFDALPFAEPERLVAVVPFDRLSGEEGNVSYPDFQDYQARARGLEAIAACSIRPLPTMPWEPSL